LSDAEGATLLQEFRLRDDPDHGLFFTPVPGPLAAGRDPERFQEVAHEFGGHALALILLASYFLRRYAGDLRNWQLVARAVPRDESDLAQQARRVMASYETLFTRDRKNRVSAACSKLLKMLGLFTRPVPLSLLQALWEDGPIRGLSDKLDPELVALALDELRRLRLISRRKEGREEVLDSHPLIREHFGGLLKRRAAMWRKAHDRLFERLCSHKAARREDLLQAVIHGCKAGRYRTVLRQVLQSRLMQSKGGENDPQVGPILPLLTALSQFFEDGDWQHLLTGGTAGERLGPLDSLFILTQAGLYLTFATGWAGRDVIRVFQQARDICESTKVEDANYFRALRGLWNYHLLLADFDTTYQIVHRCEDLARKLQNDAFQLEAVHIAGVTHHLAGNHEEARNRLSDSACRYDLTPYGTNAFLFGIDPGISSNGHLAHTLWAMGCLTEARSHNQRTLELAEQVHHPFSQALALHRAALFHQWCGDKERVADLTGKLGTLANRQGFGLFLLLSRFMSGVSQANDGRAEGWQIMRETLAAYANEGTVLGMSRDAAQLMEVYKKANQMEAWQSLWNEFGALPEEREKEDMWTAELFRLKGDYHLAQVPPDPSEAEKCYRRAQEIARNQGAVLFEVRAANGLAGLLAATGRVPEAQPVLQDAIARPLDAASYPEAWEAQATLARLTQQATG
jgi:tetratricopeptide (TPR) repeat protein